MNFEFPQYRKLKNGQSYYQLENPSLLHEIQLIGQRWTTHDLAAKILPERNLLTDILLCADEAYVVIDAAEYDAFLAHCETHLKRF